jgi:hypothetical protein
MLRLDSRKEVNKDILMRMGHAIAQVVSRRVLTAEAQARSQIRTCGICNGQSGSGTGFLRVFRFLLSILISPNIPHSSIIWGWYNGSISGRHSKWIRSHPTPQNQRKILIRMRMVVNKLVLVYGSECWTYGREENGRSEAAQMRFLRRLVRLIRRDHTWSKNIRYQLGE